MFDVLVVGELNVDIILDQIDGFPEIGKEKLAKNFTLTLGSSSAIFASNLATLGRKVAFMGKTGNDDFGKFIEASLKTRRVDTGFIIHSPEYKTGSTVVLNYDMDRAMVTHPGAMEHLSEKEIGNEILKQANHLHVSSIFLQPKLKTGIVELFRRAKKMGLSTSLDPQWDPEEKWDLNLSELLPHVDVFLPNRKELKFLTHTSSIEEGIRSLQNQANTLAIKDGENGAVLFHDGELLRKEAFLNKNVADCIGAGDSFDAGFISQYIQGVEPSKCLEFANLTGAVNTTHPGGTTAFESLDQVKEIARKQFSYSI